MTQADFRRTVIFPLRIRMNRIIEVIYEDNVFKPLQPVEGLNNRQKTWILLYPSEKRGTDELIGTLSPEEAAEMQCVIDREFSKIEGEW